MDTNDRRAEHLFQSLFHSAPQVYYSLSCYNFLLDTRPTPNHAFGSYFPWKEPNAIGVFVTAHASRHGITFEKSNLAFGDTANQKICVSFQACTISTGTDVSEAGLPI